MDSSFISAVVLMGAMLAAVYAFVEHRARSRLQAGEEIRTRLQAEVADASKHLRGERDQRLELESLATEYRRTLAKIPGGAQALMESREAREVPDRALALVEELLRPQYAVFFACTPTGFVATHQRGNSPFPVRSQVSSSRGVVAWAAMKQLLLTPEDITQEATLIKSQYFSDPQEHAFEFCIPVVDAETTVAILLIGPLQRAIPSGADLARLVGVMTAQSMRSVHALTRQRQLAMTDGLTGLLNKKSIHEHLQNGLLSGKSSVQAFGVFLFDIDHFKHYNDRNGHLAGDELLRSLSKLLREITREAEVLGRYGGEEFLLLMPNATKQAALLGAERVREAIAKHAFPFGEAQPAGYLSISGGVAAFPEDGHHGRALLAAADHALYTAKREGRNRVVAYAGERRVLTEDGHIKLSEEEGEDDAVITLEDQVLTE